MFGISIIFVVLHTCVASSSHKNDANIEKYRHFESERQLIWNAYAKENDMLYPYKSWYSSNRVVLNPHRSGVRATSAIINDEHHLIMCTVPKAGSSTWRRFMLYLAFPETFIDATHADTYAKSYGKHPTKQVHNISRNGVKNMGALSPAQALDYYNNPNYWKVFHVRNPIVRLLSAWLSKNAQSRDPLEFAAPYKTFPEFVQHLQRDNVDLTTTDAHIKLQSTFCDYDRGAHYDAYLRFEASPSWRDVILKYTNTLDNQLYSFVRSTSIVPSMGTDSLNTLLTHYDLKTLQIARQLYEIDVRAFNYTLEVDLIEKAIRAFSK